MIYCLVPPSLSFSPSGKGISQLMKTIQRKSQHSWQALSILFVNCSLMLFFQIDVTFLLINHFFCFISLRKQFSAFFNMQFLSEKGINFYFRFDEFKKINNKFW